MVTVTTKDFEGYTSTDAPASNSKCTLQGTKPNTTSQHHPLAGMFFQEHWERRAFQAAGGNYAAPAQRLVDFLRRTRSETLPDHLFMGKLASANLNECLPAFVCQALRNAFDAFGKKMPGLLDEDTLLIGVETRTSSPVRIPRDPNTFQVRNILGRLCFGCSTNYISVIMYIHRV